MVHMYVVMPVYAITYVIIYYYELCTYVYIYTHTGVYMYMCVWSLHSRVPVHICLSSVYLDVHM
jgi:hypothetical protein